MSVSKVGRGAKTPPQGYFPPVMASPAFTDLSVDAEERKCEALPNVSRPSDSRPRRNAAVVATSRAAGVGVV